MAQWNPFRNKLTLDEEPEKKYTPDDKLNYEVKRLKAEIVNLRQPWVLSPASWIAIATTIAALGGLTIQSCKSDRDYQLAEIKKERAEHRIVQLQDQIAVAQSQLSIGQDNLVQITSRAAEAQSKFDRIQLTLKRLGDDISRLPITDQTNSLRKVIQEITESTGELVIANQRDTQTLDDTASNLQALSSSLTDPNGSLPAFAIIGSFRQRDQALARSQELVLMGLEYKPEVYQRDASRFALTLGGNLSYQEALKRVKYAKERGLARDAYVKLAKGWGENLSK